MSGIFISYRRLDTRAYAGRLRDACTRMGHKRVFMDVTDIGPGTKFEEVIGKALGSCDLFLAVIGPKWLTCTKGGERRLEDRGDFVRLEITTALHSPGVRVVPVLVDGAKMPSANVLPKDLRPLTQIQAIELRDSSWAADVDNLLHHVKNPRRRYLLLAGSAVVAITAVVALFLIFDPGASNVVDRKSGPTSGTVTPTPPLPPREPRQWTLQLKGNDLVDLDAGKRVQDYSQADLRFEAAKLNYLEPIRGAEMAEVGRQVGRLTVDQCQSAVYSTKGIHLDPPGDRSLCVRTGARRYSGLAISSSVSGGTGRRVGIGATIGTAIGAIAGGGKGAAVEAAARRRVPDDQVKTAGGRKGAAVGAGESPLVFNIEFTTWDR